MKAFKSKMSQTQKEEWLLKHRDLWIDVPALALKAIGEKIYSPKAAWGDVRSSIRGHIHRIEKAERAGRR